MGDRTSLGDRMKGYECVTRSYLMRRNPVLIRLNGKSFHTFTRGMMKPFDEILQKTMQDTMKYLCENIQNCKLAYTQSDEITLLLVDYQELNTDVWFGNNIQKMASVSASMATLAFNESFEKNVMDAICEVDHSDNNKKAYLNTLGSKFNKALFDSRVFSIPKDDVCNCFLWRQQDATRNSIQSVGQANFSHKKLHKKSVKMIQEMLFTELGINWNDYSTTNKRGCCCVRVDGQWIIDEEIPIFSQDRNYIERFVFI